MSSPRPWPAPATELPRTSAWRVLSARGLAETLGPLGGLGCLGGAVLPELAEQSRRASGERRDATPTADGWKVPRNPQRTPVRPRDPFEIKAGTEDLGPLRVVSTLGGRIRALRLQWPEEFQEPAFSAQQAVFQDLLTRLPGDVRLEVVAEGLGGAALASLLKDWSVPEPGRVRIHPLHLRTTSDQWYQPMTLWARDGAILLRAQDGARVLLLPRSFRGDGQVDASLNKVVIQGSGAAPALLSQALPELVVRRSKLSFEGGDVVAGRRAVLLGGDSLARSMADLRLPREKVLELFEQEFGLPVVPISPQPDFHIDLGFTFLDDDTIAVADPQDTIRSVLGRRELERPIAITREKQLGEKYDQSARRLAEQGYRVVRLPNLGGLGLTTPYFTYNNVLLEGLPARRVYLPVYDLPGLDEAAREVYRQHGYQVIDMPSARLSTKLWGAVRCATGELEVDWLGAS